MVAAVVAMLGSSGMIWGAFGRRMDDIERRTGDIESARSSGIRDYETFKEQIRSDVADTKASVAEIKADVRWLRQSQELRK